MKTRKLGGSPLEVSPVCLGGNVFGWTADEAASFAILDAFVGAGFNFIDTADVGSPDIKAASRKPSSAIGSSAAENGRT
jgi:aryl-alcohol dehydrogenase-like predicted oxidoreductase